MRLLQVISSMSPNRGGPAQGIRNFAPILKSLDVVNEVLTLDCEIPDGLDSEEYLIHAKGSGKTSWGYSRTLFSWLEQNVGCFDAVIIRECWQYPLIAAASLCQKVGVPYFIMPHGTLDPWFQRDSSRRIKSLRNWFYWKLLLERHISRAEAIFFTCEAEKLLARETFTPYRPKREIVVGYGIIDPVQQADNVKEWPDRKAQYQDSYTDSILFLGRIDSKKGVDLLIQAYSRLCKASACDDVSLPSLIPDLVIAGPGLDSSYGQRCLELCRNAGLDTVTPDGKCTNIIKGRLKLGRVCFPGILLGAEKWQAFRSASAMVLPSHQENFGIVVAEALACGTPVLISDQVNIWREVEAAGAGMVAEDTLEGTYQLLCSWLMMTKGEQSAIKLKARSCFERYFRVEESAKNLTYTIKSLIQIDEE